MSFFSVDLGHKGWADFPYRLHKVHVWEGRRREPIWTVYQGKELVEIVTKRSGAYLAKNYNVKDPWLLLKNQQIEHHISQNMKEILKS